MNTAVADDIRFFDLNSRIGRLRYLAYGIGAILLAAVGMAVGGILATLSQPLGFAAMGIVYLAMLVLNVAFGVRRLHDLDKSGWLMLLMIVPLVNFGLAIYLIFFPGTIGENGFGEEPPPNSGWVILGAVCYIGVIPIIGILAAIAIPAYQDYVARAQMTEGVQLAQGADVAFSEYVNRNKALPARLSLVYPLADQNPAGVYVATVTGNGSGSNYSVVATMKDTGVNRMIAGKSVEIWTYDTTGTWHCGPGGPDPVDPKYLPQTCRETDAP